MKSWPRRLLWSAAPLAIAASLLVAPAGRAMAQAIAEQLATCKKEGGGLSTRIAACTLDHRQGQAQRGHPHRGTSASRRAARARRRQGGRDQGLQRRDRARCRQRARPFQPRQRLRPAGRPRPRDRRLHTGHQDRRHRRRRVQQPRPDLRVQGRVRPWRSPTTRNRYGSTPRTPGAFFNRGSAYEQLGEHDRAIADYSRSRSGSTRATPRSFNSRGQAYDYKGEHDLAIADYNQSIRLSRDNPRAYFNRGVALCQQGRLQGGAIADFDEAIRLDPERRRRLPEPRRHARGARQCRPPRAPTTRKALEILPEHEDARESLARLGN